VALASQVAALAPQDSPVNGRAELPGALWPDYRCSTSASSTSTTTSLAADEIVHRRGLAGAKAGEGVSCGYRSQCRPGTEAASGQCRGGTGARVSPSYRTSTDRGWGEMERETGFEPATLCLGSTGVMVRTAR
jgi:hypothetical protein